MVASDQQPSGILITVQEKEKLALSRKIIYPFLVLFGTFGNVMIIVIHKRTALTSSMSVFFLTLAASDLMLLCASCFRTWIRLVFDLNITAQSNVLCKLVMFLIYVSGVLSAWTLVAHDCPKSCLCHVATSRKRSVHGREIQSHCGVDGSFHSSYTYTCHVWFSCWHAERSQNV